MSKGTNSTRKGPSSLPWTEILTSVPFGALTIAHIGNVWAYYTLLTEVPSYLNSIQHFPLAKVNQRYRVVFFFFSFLNGLNY